MTCIVAVKDHEVGRILMAGDAAAVSGHLSGAIRDAKIFTRGPYLIGNTGSFRIGQILRYDFDIPEPSADDDIMTFMVCVFVEQLRRRMVELAVSPRKENVDKGGNFLIAIRDRIFHIYEDFQVNERVEEYDAAGSGMEVALGALFATQDKPPEDRLRLALDAADHYGSHVRPPFSFGEIPIMGVAS